MRKTKYNYYTIIPEILVEIKVKIKVEIRLETEKVIDPKIWRELRLSDP